MQTIEQVIATVPYEMNWLIRSDERKGIFANLTHKFDPRCAGATFPCYAPTVQEALEGSIKQYKEWRDANIPT